MKKKILFIGLVLAVITAVSFQLKSKKGNLDSLMLENMEALASGEGSSITRCFGSGSVDCPTTHVKVYIVGYRSLENFN